jgi:hypothetical protein
LVFSHFSVVEAGEVGEAVLISGFPLVFDKPHAIPLFRRGTIASHRYTCEGADILVLDLGCVTGFSGSPIILADTQNVIGVMRGSSKLNTHSDFSVAEILRSHDIVGLEQLGS